VRSASVARPSEWSSQTWRSSMHGEAYIWVCLTGDDRGVRDIDRPRPRNGPATEVLVSSLARGRAFPLEPRGRDRTLCPGHGRCSTTMRPPRVLSRCEGAPRSTATHGQGHSRTPPQFHVRNSLLHGTLHVRCPVSP